MQATSVFPLTFHAELIMTLGCLTGSGKGIPVEGSYTFLHRGLKKELFPDLMEETAGGVCRWQTPVPFSEGTLTDGDPSTMVGWKGGTMGEIGVEIVVDLKDRYFVDRVVLHQGGHTEEETPGASQKGKVRPGEVPDYVEPTGLNGVEVYARAKEHGPYFLAGRLGEKAQKTPLRERTLSISLGVEARELVLRLDSFNRDVLLSGLEVWGAGLDEPKIYPIPQKMAFDGKGVFSLKETSKVVVGKEASEDTLFTANLLVEKVRENFGMMIPLLRKDEAGHSKGVVLLGKPGECGLLDEGGLTEVRAEGYRLSVRSDRVLVLASDRRGLIYGVETFLQLLGSGEEPAAETCLIEDYPKMGLRGVHFFMPAREDIPFIKRLIRYVLAPMRMNTIFLQVTAGMRFDRRPEINEAWEKGNREAAEGKKPPVPHGQLGGGSYLTKEEVREIVEYARAYGFEVIPEVQSLSHVEYLTMTYPGIAERSEDTYPDSYCPLHPESHKIVFDMIDEVIEVFQPLRYIEMGHDEVYTMGVCERCKGKSRAELYALDVNKIYDYLKSKGLGMMIWSDMLHTFRPYGCPDAIDMIPKDIVMMDFIWYFRTGEDIEVRLLEKGFKVIMGNFYSSHYPRFAARSAREGVIGAEVSTWCHANERDFGQKGKLYDFIYSANIMWSEHYRDELRWTMDRGIAELMPGIRSKLRGELYPSQVKEKRLFPIDLSGRYTAPLRDETGGKGGFDLSGLPRGEVVLRGIPFRIGEGVILVEGEKVRDRRYPSEVEVPVGAKADGLVFLHTCSSDARPRTPVGQYEVLYADGSTAEISLEYGGQMAEWDRRHAAPLAHIAHRHSGYIGTYPADPIWQGKTPTGEDMTLYGFEWVNPHREREIRAIRICASESAGDSALMVVAITGVEVEDCRSGRTVWGAVSDRFYDREHGGHGNGRPCLSEPREHPDQRVRGDADPHAELREGGPSGSLQAVAL